MYENFTDSEEDSSKGNDIIIGGLARLYQEYKDIEINFVEKGSDWEKAKALCEKVGISPVVKWHKEMPLSELFCLYEKSDICFDQVGTHWVSAIGAYALLLGKPLIANTEKLTVSGFWSEENPVLHVKNEIAVYNALKYLIEGGINKALSSESRSFAYKYFSPCSLLNEIFDFQ